MSLRNIAKKSGIESGEVKLIDQATGKEVFKSSPMNIIQGISAENPNARGDNDQIITRVPDNDTHYNQAVGHETAHQFLTRSKNAEHEIISDFGLELDAEAMDAILKDAFLDKNPIQINNSQ
ncbi:hypothetical protein [Paenimyroides baculatum]|uniref:Uncharacterized protein n=1 Tax=Paenimyroides baculatum TaxID=2608000 RepID=A0A5M6C9B1_9FLAO|nr:hypothetical protein [Paenimyroides baculatum]KAA5531603.1 hypothetical protein F0460_15950 [Paenimyroides baculatum]